MDSSFLSRWAEQQIITGGIKLSASDMGSIPALCWLQSKHLIFWT